ncbi:MAG: RIP metalloprotease RseP [Bacteroidetes bacterium]|nr:RIP metalloprotease RseP [Bacteroidota bacterium]MBU1373341.1 RIP metalloprotease RseP [Bacteroidota bacterium]MBU1484432.1 RIP metalloprotease RseP [Bacteroidota bacterium]MBU1759472.1 RIP metalloprotease RseP [Bacteroidota bacterium]MBU2268990.1 RIP metalloprotease RseP [Bacteroidota bacterium]
MDVLVMIAQMLLGLSILIVLHELGHYLAARAFGIKVEKFYLFFDAWGFKLFSIKYKDCEYGIGWLPLGGYVKIAGMIDESMDTEALEQPIQPWEFRAKPAWQRLIVMLAGVTVNVILGIFIFWMLTFKYGETYVPNDQLRYGISPGIVGQQIGLQAGDKVVAINGKPLERFDDLRSSDVLMGNSTLTVMRNGEEKQVAVPANILNAVSDYGIDEFVTPRIKSKIGEVNKGGLADKAGLKEGDEILAVNGKEAIYSDQMKPLISESKNKEVTLSILRNNEQLEIPVKVSNQGAIGLVFDISGLVTETQKFSLIAALPEGASKAWGSLTDNAKGLTKVVKGEVKANKAFSGPVEIARKLYGGTWDWIKFWSITGLLSMALALMNLLPIPALDGGHSVFLLIEMIKGKPLSDKFMERAQIVGFVLLATLMVFVLGNDIFKAFTK